MFEICHDKILESKAFQIFLGYNCINYFGNMCIWNKKLWNKLMISQGDEIVKFFFFFFLWGIILMWLGWSSFLGKKIHTESCYSGVRKYRRLLVED